MRTIIKGLLIGSAAVAGTVLAGSDPAVNGSTAMTGTVTGPAGRRAVTADPLAIRKAGMPLAFEENRGQADARVDFVARSRDFTACFAGGDVVFALRAPRTGSEMEPVEAESGGPRGTSVTAGMRFLGVREDLRLEAAGSPLPATVNYLRGSDPAKHLAGVPTFPAVVGREAWPGIDLRYEARGSFFEYSFEVSPGADLGAVAVAFPGPSGAAIGGGASRVVEAVGGDLRHSAPVAWQEKDGGRDPVAVAFLPRGDGSVGFSVGSHDPSRAVFIDPTVDYKLYHGGQGGDTYYAARVDGSGNLFLAGYSYDTGAAQDYPYGTALGSAIGGSSTSDVIVAKFSSTGTLTWATIIGGDSGGYDEAYALALDGNGDPWVAGYTDSTNYLESATPFQTGLAGGSDGFVTGLNSTGTAANYSSYLGGTTVSYGEFAQGVAVDSTGIIHVVGIATSTDFTNATNSLSGTSDAFYAVMSTNAATLYMQYVGGSAADSGYAVALDASDNVFMCGTTASNNFPTSVAYDATLGSTGDGFVRAYDSSQAVLFSTYLGGAGGIDAATSIVVDGSGDPWITGSTYSNDFPVLNPAQAKRKGGRDAFVTRLHYAPAGPATTLTYSTYFGGSLDDIPFAIALDGDGVVAIAGYTTSTNLPVVNAHQASFGGGTSDGFAARIDPTPGQSAVLHATYLGGTLADSATGVALTSTGTVIAAGGTSSANFPASNASAGLSDGHLTRVSFEEVNLSPYWGSLTDSQTALKDLVNVRCWYGYSNRAGANTFTTASPLLLKVTPPGGAATLVFDTTTATGTWKTTVKNGNTTHTWVGVCNGIKWTVKFHETIEEIWIYATGFTFTAPIASAPYNVQFEVDWNSIKGFHDSPFRNSATFNATWNNSVLRRP